MLIREVIQINEDTIYRFYSDEGFYVRNKNTNTLFTDVNCSIDFDFEETDIPIHDEDEELSESEILNILLGNEA